MSDTSAIIVIYWLLALGPLVLAGEHAERRDSCPPRLV